MNEASFPVLWRLVCGFIHCIIFYIFCLTVLQAAIFFSSSHSRVWKQKARKRLMWNRTGCGLVYARDSLCLQSLIVCRTFYSLFIIQNFMLQEMFIFSPVAHRCMCLQRLWIFTSNEALTLQSICQTVTRPWVFLSFLFLCFLLTDSMKHWQLVRVCLQYNI